MADRRKAFGLIFSHNHCQKFLPSQISDTPWARFKFVQNLYLGFDEYETV